MSLTLRNIALMAGMTMLTMWTFNLAASQGPLLRRLIRGEVVTPVETGESDNGTVQV